MLLSMLLSWALVDVCHSQDLSVRLNRLIKQSPIPKQNLSLSISHLGTKSELKIFSLNEHQSFIPASITKIATAVAVLHELGPAFKFQTTLWATAPIKQGILRGDLILKGGGDPGFVSETMWFLVNDLLRSGLKKIEGDVIVDDTAFDHVRSDGSRDPERVDRAYDAPVGAMSLNWNSINIYVRPALLVGQPGTVILDPLGDYYSMDNRTKTVSGAGSHLDFTRNGHRILVSGTIGVGNLETVAYKNVDNPADWSGRNLVAFLNQRGITVSGQVKFGARPVSSQQVAKAESKPVSQSIADMLKFSNNFVAEMLTKGMAMQKSTPATLADGMKLVQEHLTVKSGLDSKNFNLVNPSGLSRKNLIRAADLNQVLVHAQRHFPTFAEFLAALPMAGIDGTLKRRMTKGPGAGWVRAKTGRMSGIVGLAGYVGSANGELRSFVFIYNGKSALDEEARHLFDALATELVE